MPFLEVWTFPSACEARYTNKARGAALKALVPGRQSLRLELAKRANDATWVKRHLKSKLNFVSNEPDNQLNL